MYEERFPIEGLNFNDEGLAFYDDEGLTVGVKYFADAERAVLFCAGGTLEENVPNTVPAAERQLLRLNSESLYVTVGLTEDDTVVLYEKIDASDLTQENFREALRELRITLAKVCEITHPGEAEPTLQEDTSLLLVTGLVV